MTPALRKILLEDAFNPYRLSGNEAIYSVDGVESDATYRTNGLGRPKLLADRSGNSAVNCLVLPGTASNYASMSALSAPGTGAFTVSCKLMVHAITAADQGIIASAANGFYLRVKATTGKVESVLVGVASNGDSTGSVSAFVPVVITYTRTGTTGTYYFNGVFDKNVTDSRDYSVGCSFIGCLSAAANNLGANIFWVRCYSAALDASQVAADAAGQVQANCIFNSDPSGVAKLAASFTESSANAATVTINTSGDLGARISGARDSVEFTATKIGLIATDAFGRNYLTLDGSNDYYKSAPFPLSQPWTRYSVVKMVSWTAGDVLFDGATTNTGQLEQRTGSPRLDQFAGSYGANTSDLPVGSRGIITSTWNGASSSIQINLGASVTGNAGSGIPNGIALGATGAASGFANMELCEEIIRTGDDSEWLKRKIIRYLARKWAVAA